MCHFQPSVEEVILFEINIGVMKKGINADVIGSPSSRRLQRWGALKALTLELKLLFQSSL